MTQEEFFQALKDAGYEYIPQKERDAYWIYDNGDAKFGKGFLSHFKAFINDRVKFEFIADKLTKGDARIQTIKEKLNKEPWSIDEKHKNILYRGELKFIYGVSDDNYFCIKPVGNGALNQNQGRSFDDGIKILQNFQDTIVKTGMVDIFHDVFGEAKPSQPGKTKTSRNNASVDLEQRQVIYFGAPGTGKSFQLKNDSENGKFTELERVTFYPGYSYQQFVGTYKPGMEGDKIVYKFVEGPLLRVLEKALKDPKHKYLLIVEELNRAEAAAVFGDLFQLLDRDSNGNSEYSISVSKEMNEFLFGKEKEGKLQFPSNFYIYATMNSADQGVFPLDTAFKRRWDFKYFGINDSEKALVKKDEICKFWNALRKAINKNLINLNLNEDKLLGPFFMKAEGLDEKTFWERFCSKVILYLYEDAARMSRDKIFKHSGSSKKTYSEICNSLMKLKDAKGAEDIQKGWDDVFTFALELKDYPWSAAASEPESEEPESVTPADNTDAENEQNAVVEQ